MTSKDEKGLKAIIATKKRKLTTDWVVTVQTLTLAFWFFAQTIGCTKTPKQKKRKGKKTPRVEVTPARKKNLVETLSLTGSVEPTQVARMASPVDGPVVWCKVREGDGVSPGQLLARIGRLKGDRAAAANAQKELEIAKIELERIEKLVKVGAVPGAELDQARLQLGNARAKLAQTAEKLGDYRITAPFSGIVYRVHAYEGDFTSAKSVLMEIYDPSSLLLRFAIPETVSLHVKPKSKVEVTLDAYPGENFRAEVVRLFPEIERKTGTRIVEAKLPDNIKLVPGMFARITLAGRSAPNATVVPSKAVVQLSDKKAYLFVVGNGGSVKRRFVTPGLEVGESIQIKEGVQPGDKVVISGHGGLGAAKKVRFKVQGKKDKTGGKVKGGNSTKQSITPSRDMQQNGASTSVPAETQTR